MYNEMLINGRDIGLYGARLLTFSVGATSFTKETITSYSPLFPSVLSSTYSTRPLSVTLVFRPAPSGSSSKGMSVRERLVRSTENISRFESLILNNDSIEIKLPDGFSYCCVCKSIGTPVFDSSGEQEIVYTFDSIRHTACETFKLTGHTTTVMCRSTCPTPFVLKFTVPEALTSIRIAGILIKNVNANDEIVIDSQNRVVTQNGINKFADTDLLEFPLLKPGKNSIDSSQLQISGTISYYPIYI